MPCSCLPKIEEESLNVCSWISVKVLCRSCVKSVWQFSVAFLAQWFWRKLSSSSVIFSFSSKLHSCDYIRYASMYWLQQYFKKCLRHFFKIMYNPECWCFIWITGAVLLNSFCYLSQLLFKEPSTYCMNTLWPFLLV